MLSIRNAQLAHQQHLVLRDVSLELHPGDRIALLGASGAGKSTLLAHLRKQAGQPLAWCPQDTGLVPMLSVFHNIYMGQLHCRPLWQNLGNLVHPSTRAMAEVRNVAARVGLEDKLTVSVDRLSGGQAQRVALARGLFTPARLLLADEPLSGVDQHQARRILDDILPDYDCSVVALHDRELALACCTRIIGLRDGRVVMDQPRDTVTLAQLDTLY